MLPGLFQLADPPTTTTLLATTTAAQRTHAILTHDAQRSPHRITALLLIPLGVVFLLSSTTPYARPTLLLALLSLLTIYAAYAWALFARLARRRAWRTYLTEVRAPRVQLDREEYGIGAQGEREPLLSRASSGALVSEIAQDADQQPQPSPSLRRRLHAFSTSLFTRLTLTTNASNSRRRSKAKRMLASGARKALTGLTSVAASACVAMLLFDALVGVWDARFVGDDDDVRRNRRVAGTASVSSDSGIVVRRAHVLVDLDEAAAAVSARAGARAGVAKANGDETVRIPGPGPRHTYPKLGKARFHIQCETAQQQPPSLSPSTSVVHAAKHTPWPPKPDPAKELMRPTTALIMTHRGVAGSVGAQWVRDMIRASASQGGGDGHGALHSVCFWDRFGYGLSEYVERAIADVPLHTEVVRSALDALGAWTLPDPAAGNFTATPSETEFPSPGGPYVVISTGYGALYASHFAATYARMVHAHIYIDAETPSSWYTPLVSLSSGLRGGYGAAHHARLSLGWIARDVLPPLFAPLGVAHLLGIITSGAGARQRILAPSGRGGAAAHDAGGGGWRIRRAGGAQVSLLVASLRERGDANDGVRSHNYRALLDAAVPRFNTTAAADEGDDEARRTTRVAVLSSFWKTHADPPGWGSAQRDELVRPAMECDALVGWWRVGRRDAPPGVAGSDDGTAAMGICQSPDGQVWCREAVRRILTTVDVDSHQQVQGAASGLDRWTFDV